MKIWVDADACPKPIKEIIFRAAERKRIETVFVANQGMYIQPSAFIRLLVVSSGADVADDEIIKQCEEGDIVVTADIPLAARAVECGTYVIDPRGKTYDRDNIRQILSMRDFMDTLRGSGIETGGPSAFGMREREKFSNLLDKYLASNQSKQS